MPKVKGKESIREWQEVAVDTHEHSDNLASFPETKHFVCDKDVNRLNELSFERNDINGNEFVKNIGDADKNLEEPSLSSILSLADDGVVLETNFRNFNDGDVVHIKQTRGPEVFFTVAVFASYFSMGLCQVFGPSLVDLQELFQVSPDEITSVAIGVGAGYLAGSILGGILIERLTQTFYFVIASTGTCVSLAVVAWMPNLPLFISMATMVAICQGLTDTGGTVVILSCWIGTKHVHSLVQGSRLMVSVGEILAPFIMQPFLSSSLPYLPHNQTSDYESLPYDNSSYDYLYSQEIFYTESRVQIGIVTVATILVVPAVLCAIAFFQAGGEPLKRRRSTPSSSLTPQPPLRFRIIMTTLLCIFYFMYVCLDFTTSSLIGYFVVYALNWERYKGPILIAVYWGAFGFGRLFGVLVSGLLTAVKILYIDLIVMNSAVLILLTSIGAHEAVVWVSIAILGLGSGSVAAAGFCFASKYMRVGGALSSSVTVVIGGAIMVGTPVTGHLFVVVGPLSVVYVMFSSAVLCMISFVVLHVYACHECSCGVSAEEKGIPVTEMETLNGNETAA